MKLQKIDEKAFTIVELMISTVVFSMVLMVCSLGIVHVGRMYYKGMIMNRTQDVARKVVDDVTRAIQLNTTGSNHSINPGLICIGRSRYLFDNSRMRGDDTSNPQQLRHILWRDSIALGASCSDGGALNSTMLANEPPTSSILGMELLGKNMRLPVFDVAPPGADGLWTVSVTVSYGEEGDFELGTPVPFTICKGVNAGGQFCAVSSYTTKVKSRL